MALLPSEICRLILAFLEEQNYRSTFQAFLNECKYLEECKHYLTKDIRFCKTVHGKTLTQHLLDKSHVERESQGTQTPLIELSDHAVQTQVDDLPLRKSETVVQKEDQQAKYQPDITECPVLNLSLTNKRKRFNTSSISSSKRKTKLSSPANQVQRAMTSAAADAIDSELVDIDSDLDAFIQSLCSKEIPERLARCINDMNLKKAGNVTIASSICDETSNPPAIFSSKPAEVSLSLPLVNQPIPLTSVNPSEFNFSQANIIQLSESGAPILVQLAGAPAPSVIDVQQQQQQQQTCVQIVQSDNCCQDQNYSQSANDFNFGDSNMGMDVANSFLDKFFIDNEDISMIAEQFSEPVFVTLLEDFANTTNCLQRDQATTPPPINTPVNNDEAPEQEAQQPAENFKECQGKLTPIHEVKESEQSSTEHQPAPPVERQTNPAVETDTQKEAEHNQSVIEIVGKDDEETSPSTRHRKDEVDKSNEPSSLKENPDSTSSPEFVPKCLTTHDRSSFIIIAKKPEDTSRLEKEIADGNFASAIVATKEASSSSSSSSPERAELPSSATSTPMKKTTESSAQDPLDFQFDSSLDDSSHEHKDPSLIIVENDQESATGSNPATPVLRRTDSSSLESKPLSQISALLPKEDYSSEESNDDITTVATPRMNNESNSSDYRSTEETTPVKPGDNQVTPTKTPELKTPSPAVKEQTPPKRSKTVRELLTATAKSPTTAMMYEMGDGNTCETPTKSQQSQGGGGGGVEVTFDEILLMSMFGGTSRASVDVAEKSSPPKVRRTVAELTKSIEPPKPEALFEKDKKEPQSAKKTPTAVLPNPPAASTQEPSQKETKREKQSPTTASQAKDRPKRSQFFGDIFNKIQLNPEETKPAQKPAVASQSSAPQTIPNMFKSPSSIVRQPPPPNTAKSGTIMSNATTTTAKGSSSSEQVTSAVDLFKEEWLASNRNIFVLVKHCKMAESDAKSRLRLGGNRR